MLLKGETNEVPWITFRGAGLDQILQSCIMRCNFQKSERYCSTPQQEFINMPQRNLA